MENIHSYTFRLHKIEYDGEWLQQKTSIENHSPMHESIAIEQSEDKRDRENTSENIRTSFAWLAYRNAYETQCTSGFQSFLRMPSIYTLR